MGGDGSLAPGLNCSGSTVAECPQAQADIQHFTDAYNIDYLCVLQFFAFNAQGQFSSYYTMKGSRPLLYS